MIITFLYFSYVLLVIYHTMKSLTDLSTPKIHVLTPHSLKIKKSLDLFRGVTQYLAVAHVLLALLFLILYSVVFLARGQQLSAVLTFLGGAMSLASVSAHNESLLNGMMQQRLEGRHSHIALKTTKKLSALMRSRTELVAWGALIIHVLGLIWRPV